MSVDWMALGTAIAAVITAIGHAWNCKREIADLKKARDAAVAQFARFAGDLSAFEKALQDQSGTYRPPSLG